MISVVRGLNGITGLTIQTKLDMLFPLVRAILNSSRTSLLKLKISITYVFVLSFLPLELALPNLVHLNATLKEPCSCLLDSTPPPVLKHLAAFITTHANILQAPMGSAGPSKSPGSHRNLWSCPRGIEPHCSSSRCQNGFTISFNTSPKIAILGRIYWQQPSVSLLTHQINTSRGEQHAVLDPPGPSSLFLLKLLHTGHRAWTTAFSLQWRRSVVKRLVR